jgi:hypothetical protein
VLVNVKPENACTISFHNVLFEQGFPTDKPTLARAEIPVELHGTSNALFLGGAISQGAGLSPIRINADCRDTTIVNTLFDKAVDDQGIGTTIIGRSSAGLVLNDGLLTPANSATPTVQGFYFLLPPYTITDLLGQAGQMVALEAQQGSVLSGENFALENGDSQLFLAPGSIVLLRKNKTTGKWQLLSHQRATASGSFSAGATVYVDDREIYTLGNTPTEAISMILNGYDGHEITIIGDQTGGLTRTFVSGIGNLALSAASIAMGRGDVLKLLYLKSVGRWHQISYSRNGV